VAPIPMIYFCILLITALAIYKHTKFEAPSFFCSGDRRIITDRITDRQNHRHHSRIAHRLLQLYIGGRRHSDVTVPTMKPGPVPVGTTKTTRVIGLGWLAIV